MTGRPSMAPLTVVNLTAAAFRSEVLESPVPVLVHFWAARYDRSRVLTPTLEQLSRQHAGRAKVARFDVDEDHAIALSWRIGSVPTFVLFDQGQEMARSNGKPQATLRSMLEGAISRALGASNPRRAVPRVGHVGIPDDEPLTEGRLSRFATETRQTTLCLAAGTPARTALTPSAGDSSRKRTGPTSERELSDHFANLQHIVARMESAQAAVRETRSLDEGARSSALLQFDDALAGLRIIAERIRLLRTGESAPEIAVIGDFSAGKSTLINALLGENLCPTQASPTTSAVTRFRHGSTESFEEVKGPLRHHLSREAYRTRAAGTTGPGAQQRVSFEVRLPHESLRGLTLLDTPGFNTANREHDTDLTRAEASKAAALLYVMDINGGDVSKSGLKLLAEMKAGAGQPGVVLILSKADTKERGERDEVRQGAEDMRDGRNPRDRLFERVVLFQVPPDGARPPNDVLTVKQLWAECERLARDATDLERRDVPEALSWVKTKVDSLCAALGRVVTSATAQRQAAFTKSRRLAERLAQEAGGLSASIPDMLADAQVRVEFVAREIPNERKPFRMWAFAEVLLEVHTDGQALSESLVDTIDGQLAPILERARLAGFGVSEKQHRAKLWRAALEAADRIRAKLQTLGRQLILDACTQDDGTFYDLHEATESAGRVEAHFRLAAEQLGDCGAGPIQRVLEAMAAEILAAGAVREHEFASAMSAVRDELIHVRKAGESL